MKKMKLSGVVEKPLLLFDYIIFGILAVLMFITFQQGDILKAAGSSYALLQGHIFDFYDYTANEYGLWNTYMPSTYIMFAIWNIPLKLLGIVTEPGLDAATGVVMWYKLLPSLLYVISGFIVYKIAQVIGMGNKKSKLCAYAYLTAPIGFFSQFIYGQFDIFTVFFMLLGVYYYYKKNNWLFVLFFAIAIPFKLWPALFFVPLLLLREKNIWKIIRDVLLAAVLYAAEFIIFHDSEVFMNYVIGYETTSYIYTAGLNVGMGSVSYVILLWGFICGYAYFKKPETDVENVHWSLYLSCLVLIAIFGLSQWEPQWLLLAMPFLVLSAFINRDTRIFMIIDLIMMALFTVYIVNMWPDNVDQQLFSMGVFGGFVEEYLGTGLTMRQLFGIKDMGVVLTAFTALLIVSVIFKQPKYCLGDIKTNADNCMGWIRARFLIGVGIFAIPALICFIFAALLPYVTSS